MKLILTLIFALTSAAAFAKQPTAAQEKYYDEFVAGSCGGNPEDHVLGTCPGPTLTVIARLSQACVQKIVTQHPSLQTAGLLKMRADVTDKTFLFVTLALQRHPETPVRKFLCTVRLGTGETDVDEGTDSTL